MMKNTGIEYTLPEAHLSLPSSFEVLSYPPTHCNSYNMVDTCITALAFAQVGNEV